LLIVAKIHEVSEDTFPIVTAKFLFTTPF